MVAARGLKRVESDLVELNEFAKLILASHATADTFRLQAVESPSEALAKLGTDVSDLRAKLSEAIAAYDTKLAEDIATLTEQASSTTTKSKSEATFATLTYPDTRTAIATMVKKTFADTPVEDAITSWVKSLPTVNELISGTSSQDGPKAGKASSGNWRPTLKDVVIDGEAKAEATSVSDIGKALNRASLASIYDALEEAIGGRTPEVGKTYRFDLLKANVKLDEATPEDYHHISVVGSKKAAPTTGPKAPKVATPVATPEASTPEAATPPAESGE